MAKPKKDEIYATYNNAFCYEKGLAALEKVQNVVINPLDSHTIKINLKKKGRELSEEVKQIVRSTKGYVEHDLEIINALQVTKKKQADSGVLDTPFYG
jgi:hypothetical protein